MSFGRFLPARIGRAYYGWYIVIAAVVAQFVAVGIQNYASGVFLKPMAGDLGWSREDYANAQTIGTFVTGGLGFFIGGLIDRRGPRRLMLLGALVSGLSVIGLSRVQELWHFYLLRGLGVAAGSMCIGNMVVNVTVSKWFVRRRGIAVAFAAMGVSLAGVVLTPVAQLLVDNFGWRQGWVIIGVGVWVLILPTAFVMRRAPEDYGLHPDGDAPLTPVSGTASALSLVDEDHWTRHEAVRTAALWLLIISFGIANTGLGSLIIHLIPFLTDAGFSTSSAAILFSIHAWGAFLCKPVWGLLMGHTHARYLSAVSFLMSATAVVGLLVSADRQAWIPCAGFLFLWGLGIGGAIPLQETVWASYYGRRHLGKIRAVAMPFTIIFSAMGPKLAANLYDRSGSYTTAFLLFTSFWLLGAVLILLARQPQRRPVQPAARVVLKEGTG
jgi:MFS transporter, OFA family, oxalate/formate antiporter